MAINTPFSSKGKDCFGMTDLARSRKRQNIVTATCSVGDLPSLKNKIAMWSENHTHFHIPWKVLDVGCCYKALLDISRHAKDGSRKCCIASKYYL
jgi:hypothetical protein